MFQPLRAALVSSLLLCACSSPSPAPDSGAPRDLSSSTFTVGSTADVVADGMAQLTFRATIRDQEGNAVHGANVTFAMTGTGNFVSSASPTGGAVAEVNGFATSTRAERKQLTASVELDGKTVELPAISVNFVAGPPAQFSFTTQPSTTKAGVVMTPPVTLVVMDTNGNVSKEPFAVSVRLVRSNSGTLTGGGPFTSVDGGVTFDALTINRPQVGRALRAEAANGAAVESNLFDVILGDFSSATSTFVATPPNSIADGTSTVTLTLTARDTGGNALGSVPVSLTVSGTGNTLADAAGMTDVAGVFSTTLRSTVAETKTVIATVNSVPMQLEVTFIP